MGLIFGVMGVLNLAHGAFMLFGGIVSWFLVSRAGMTLVFTVPSAVFLSAFLGLVLWKVGVSDPISSGEDETGSGDLSSQVLVTLGFSLIVEDLVTRWAPQGIFSLPTTGPLMAVAGIRFSAIRLVLLLIVTVAFFLLNRLIMKTDLGLMVRACMQDRQGAVLMSVPYRMISLAVFIAGCAMAGLAGSLYLIIYPLTPQMSIPLTVKALLIVILGGKGRLLYTFAAAIFFGVFEVATGFWASAETQHVLPYMALVALLLISPEGIGVLRIKKWDGVRPLENSF